MSTHPNLGLNPIASSSLWRIHTAVDLYSIFHLRDAAREITQAHIPFLKVPGGAEGVDEMSICLLTKSALSL